MEKLNTVEEILFEIARTLEFCRNDPTFPGSIAYKTAATGYIKARCMRRGIEMELIEWKGGEKEVVGGDWYEIPALLLDLSKRIEAKHGRVKSFAGQFSPHNVLTLQAKGPDGVLGEWSLVFSAEEAAKARQEPLELVAQADDVSGIPVGIVGGLQDLNGWLRNRLFPLKPKAAIPVKFWKISDPVVLWSALQYLYGYLLKPYDYDDSALPPLPAGYTTVCTIFHAFEEIDNEGVETAIENLGSEYCDALVAELRRVGLAQLGDSFNMAWKAHPEGTKPDSTAFDAIVTKLHEEIDDEVTLDAIHRYVGGHAQLFERE
jgi:hypothetical protein